MRFKNTILAAGAFLIATFFVVEKTFSQQFKRQVISSLGTNHLPVGSSGICLASTTGQPPGSSVIGTGLGNCLRQGFQQPANDGVDCGFQIAFDVTEQATTGCGSFYIFEYSGAQKPNMTVSWDFGPNASPQSFVGLMSPNVAFSQSGLQEITITVSDPTCSANYSQMVNAKASPFSVQPTVTNAKCFGDKGAITLQNVGGSGPFGYTWADGATGATRSGLAPGDYAFTATDGEGCMFPSVAQVDGASLPLSLEHDIFNETCTDLNDGEIKLEVLGGKSPFSFTWSDSTTTTSETRTGLGAGKYKVTVKDALGCELVSTEFAVLDLCTDKEFLPDVITPNEDGVNETWEVPDLERFPNHEVQIFNRWGNLVFDRKGNFMSWHGENNNGKALPAAAYFYVIKLNDANKTVWNGSITVVK